MKAVGDGSAPISVLAQMSGRSVSDVHRLMRLPAAPAPAGFVARVRVYRVEEALSYLGARGGITERALADRQA